MSKRRQALKVAKVFWGWVPHHSQREWLLADAKVKVAACGRRWGKTEAAAVDVATQAILNPGCRQMIVSPSYDQSRIIIDTVERLLSSNRHLNRLYSIIKTPYTRISICGSLISARTADEDGNQMYQSGLLSWTTLKKTRTSISEVTVTWMLSVMPGL